MRRDAWCVERVEEFGREDAARVLKGGVVRGFQCHDVARETRETLVIESLWGRETVVFVSLLEGNRTWTVELCGASMARSRSQLGSS